MPQGEQGVDTRQDQDGVARELMEFRHRAGPPLDRGGQGRQLQPEDCHVKAEL